MPPTPVKKKTTIEPGTYKHFKGGYYEVFGVAKHSETNEEMVVYQSLKDEGLWVRPLAMFSENVEVEGKLVPRFEEVAS